MAKRYRTAEAQKLRTRQMASEDQRPAKRVGKGKYAHPQPRGSQERKGKR